MPSVATGALMANRTLIGLGVSGDGDTASIGVGQYIHLVRRNLPLVYIIEDNGVYGLTKGQFSATADAGSTSKSGVVNQLPAIDTCLTGHPARRNLRGPELLRGQEAALGDAQGSDGAPGDRRAGRHLSLRDLQRPRGVDQVVLYMKDHEEPIHELSFIPSYEDIAVEYDPGATVSAKMHDGSRLQLRKLEEGYDPRDKLTAVTRIMSSHAQQEVLTGVLYVNTELPNFYDLLGLPDVPLATLPQAVTRPPKNVLDEVMDSLG